MGSLAQPAARPLNPARGRGIVDRARASWPTGAAGRTLLALVVLGAALRVLTIVSWWPTTILEDSYQNFARTNPFTDPLHPAGYGLILAALGKLTHQIAVPVLLQHVSGIISALLVGAATRRITRSAWAGLVPAAVMLLDGDQLYLEHSIMSESWVILATSVGLYAAVRTIDQPESWRPWPLITGAALAIAVTIRSADLPIIAAVLVALVVAHPTMAARWRMGWRAPAAVAGVAVTMLLAFAAANAGFGARFGIAPSPGWYLYGRVAQFADCSRFTPPPGTAALCQKTPVAERESPYYYMFVAQAPALRLFGTFGKHDGLIGAWARRALIAQFGDFLSTAWTYLRSYYVPSSMPSRLKPSTGLDPQLDFTNRGNIFYDAAALEALQSFFGRFTVHRIGWGLRVLRSWQIVIRFGATALFATTVLTLIGLLIGTRRSRAGVVLFGVGGLSLLVAPVLTGTYSGRYTVPMAGLLTASAAITITELWRAYPVLGARTRRR